MAAPISTRVAVTALAAGLAQLGPAVLGCPGVTGLTTRRRPLPAGEVLLTFDDGPHPHGTPAVLDHLAAHQVRAIFFVVGEQLVHFPEVARRIVADGHEIGVHGWNHRPLPAVSPVTTWTDIRRTVNAVNELTGAVPRWYRPPYGLATGTALLAARAAGLRPLWWSKWGRDWDRSATPQSIAARALSGFRPGRTDVILLHDSDTYSTPGSWQHTVCAVDEIITVVRARGQHLSQPPLAGY